ncbi:MAG: hypothetical protein NT151_13570 [Acidobacteria bacterium]|nr:hypothetical protein [Acidobacteriota bacterium]
MTTFASDLRVGVQSGVRSIVQAPSMQVPPAVWAGVIQIFWVVLTVGAALTYSLLALAGTLATGGAGLFGQQPVAERYAVWLSISALFYLVQLSCQLPLAFGLFTMKRWAYGLYLWTVGPLTLIGLILRFVAPSTPELDQRLPLSLSMLSALSLVFALGLLALQVFLVLKSKDRFVG